MSVAPQRPPPEAGVRSAERRVLAAASIGTMLVLITFTAPLTTLGVTAGELGSGPAAQTWLLSSMSLGLAVALLTSGALGDDLGRRRVFVIGTAVLCVASVGCAVAPTSLVFVLGRVAQGLGGAAMTACSLGLIGHTFSPGPARARAAGVWGASVGAGIALGPLLSAGLAQLHSWRDVYTGIAVVAGALAVAARLGLAESRAARPRRIDVVGMVLLTGALSALLVGLIEGRGGWVRAATLVPLVLAAGLLGAFVGAERRVDEPMLDLALFARPAFFDVTVAALTTGLTIIGLMSYLPTVLQRGLGHDTLTSAALLLLWSATSIGTALAARRLPARVSGRAQLVGSLLVVAAGEAVLALLDTAHPIAILVPGLLLAGAGSGVLNAALGREAVASVPADRAAMGSGANNTARYLGSAVGVTVVVAVAAARGGAQTSAALLTGWDTAALVGAIGTVLGAAVILARARVAGG